MRNFLFITVFLFTSCSLFSGKTPEAVSRALEQKFPGATNIKWGKESENEWEANFRLNNLNASANFSNTGEWLETETEIPVSRLPGSVVSAIQEADKGCKITGAAMIESSKSETVYEADIKTGLRKKEVFYNQDGVIAK